MDKNQKYAIAFESAADLYRAEIGMDAAIEADMGEDQNTSKVCQETSDKLKSAIAEYREAVKKNDKDGIATAKAKINSIAHDVEQSANAAKTNEERKKWIKVAKYGAAAIAAVAATIGSAYAISKSPAATQGKNKNGGVTLNIMSNNSDANVSKQGLSMALGLFKKLIL